MHNCVIINNPSSQSGPFFACGMPSVQSDASRIVRSHFGATTGSIVTTCWPLDHSNAVAIVYCYQIFGAIAFNSMPFIHLHSSMSASETCDG